MKRPYYFFIFLIIFFGLFFRIWGFINIPDLYNDEASLAFNLFDKNYLDFFSYLDYRQSAPFLFLFFTKIITKFVHNFEYSLRILPFTCSILSIFVFYFICRKFFKNKFSILFSLILFVLNIQLLTFCNVFKQYSCDVLIYNLVLLSYFYSDFNNKKQAFFYSIIYSFLMFFSFSSIFMILPVVLLKSYQAKKPKVLLCLIPVLISCIFIVYCQKSVYFEANFVQDWTDGFINYNLSNVFVIFSRNIAWLYPYAPLRVVVFVFFIYGFVLCVKKRSKNNLIIFLSLFFVFLSSYFRLYPCLQRVSLYLTGLYIIISAFSFEYSDFRFFKNKTSICYILMFIFFGFNMFANYKAPKYIENIEDVLQLAQNKMKKEDILYVPLESSNAVKFYLREKKQDYNFSNVLFENVSYQEKKNIKEYISLLNNLEKDKKYYYIFVHYSKKQEMLKELYLFAKNKKEFEFYPNFQNLNALFVFKT